MSEPCVHAILLNWRTPEMTLRAAETCRAAMDGIAGGLTIVDNDSGDGSEEMLRSKTTGWDRVQVLQSGHNGGFGAGNNFGIRAGLPNGARPDYVYLLNSDAFPEPEAIAALLAHLEAHPKTGIAGSTIRGDDDAPHITAFRFPSIASEFEGAIRFGPVSRLLRRHIVPLPMPETTRRVDWLAGASMMIRQEVLDEIGLFDEQFFLYFEETDLCHRAADAGWSTDYVVESRVVHIGSVSTGMKKWARVPRYWLESRWHYFAKRGGRFMALGATLAHVTAGVIWRLRRIIERKPAADPPHFLRDLIHHDARAAFSALPESKV